MFPIKIERLWLRIIVSVIAGGIAGYACRMVFTAVVTGRLGPSYAILGLSFYVIGPTVAAVFAHMLTPREVNDGHTRCGKCGYILKGLTEPRCSECGERI